MDINNNGSKAIVNANGNRFELGIESDGMMLEMTLTAREMHELIEYAQNALSEMIYD